jgi:hypothetical protein
MHLIVATLAQILQIIVIERHVRVVDVDRSDRCFVVDDISQLLVTLLAQPAVNALSLGYVRSSTLFPCPRMIK